MAKTIVVTDGKNALTVPASERGFYASLGWGVPEAEESPQEFNPDEHNVAEVVTYLNTVADEAEKERVLAAEAAGQARKGIMNYSAEEDLM